MEYNQAPLSVFGRTVVANSGAFQDYWTDLLHLNFIGPSLIFFLPILLSLGALWGTPQIAHALVMVLAKGHQQHLSSNMQT